MAISDPFEYQARNKTLQDVSICRSNISHFGRLLEVVVD